jgi:hypothetical protein
MYVALYDTNHGLLYMIQITVVEMTIKRCEVLIGESRHRHNLQKKKRKNRQSNIVHDQKSARPDTYPRACKAVL